jgi:hypothetical protein
MQISIIALQNFHANCALITTKSSPWVLPLWPQSDLAFLSLTWAQQSLCRSVSAATEDRI